MTFGVILPLRRFMVRAPLLLTASGAVIGRPALYSRSIDSTSASSSDWRWTDSWWRRNQGESHGTFWSGCRGAASGWRDASAGGRFSPPQGWLVGGHVGR